MSAFVAEMGFALPMRHKLPQVLPEKMPPGGKRMARLSDWLPFVTRPRAFGFWLDRSREADGGWGGVEMLMALTHALTLHPLACIYIYIHLHILFR